MPFNPFTSVTGRNALTLFDIRLENDFLVFRGNEHEASGQLLKGVVAICVPSPLKIEDIHLRLTGLQRLIWNDPRVTPSGLSSQKVDRSHVVLQHQWAPFWGTPGKSAVLEKGNYEFPFELLLPGDTSESVEGLHEASITYKLKATIARGKLAYDLHAYKHLRIVRTLESSALEFLHAMSVENIWPNKIEYSIVVPQKAIVFGSSIPLETRFTPLLKGLEIGDISIRLLEIHDIVSMPASASNSGFHPGMREYKNERTVSSWTLNVSHEENWHDLIEDTGQEGWVLNTALDLPRKLGKCVQDVNVHGIKVRHKLKMVVALKNPDGHVSELRATLPLTIFISPNIPLDEQGNLSQPEQLSTSPSDVTNIAPPGYGEHILDQLYDEVDIHNLQTPAPMSAVHSPIYGMSRAGSSENLASMASIPVPPAALTSRLQDVSSRSSTGWRTRSSTVVTPPGSVTPYSPFPAPYPQQQQLQHPQRESDTAQSSQPTSRPVSRRDSGDGASHHSEHNDPEHIDYPDLSELCKVPSYATAMKNTRVNAILVGNDEAQLPDYVTAATSAPPSRSASFTNLASAMAGSGSNSATGTSLPVSEPLFQISEMPQEQARPSSSGTDAPPALRTALPRSHTVANFGTAHGLSLGSGRRRQTTNNSPSGHGHARQSSSQTLPHGSDSDERGWLHVLQLRGRVTT